MVRAIVTFIYMSLALFIMEANAQTNTGGLRGDGWTVTVDRVGTVANKSSKLYRVELTYSFSKYSTIWVDGLGTIQPAGQINIATASETIVFRTEQTAQPLATVPISTAIFNQPVEAGIEYPPTVNSTTTVWKIYGTPVVVHAVISDFTPLAMKTLNSLSNGAAEDCYPTASGCLMTPWVRVFNGDRSKGNYGQGDVAVMLIYSQQTVSGRTSIGITVYFAERQGLAGSTTWNYGGGTDVQGAAVKFINALIARISS
jgi:hypothetical protein